MYVCMFVSVCVYVCVCVCVCLCVCILSSDPCTLLKLFDNPQISVFLGKKIIIYHVETETENIKKI